MVQIVANEIWSPEQIEVHRYTHVALPRRISITTLAEWTHSLKAALQAQKRVMVAFRSKKNLHAVLASIKQWFPGIKYLAFSSDSTEQEMEAFQHIDAHVKHVQLLCFTSKVTVGADIQTRFDQVYLHAGSVGGCTAREAFQMLGRARNVADTTIRVVIPQARSDARVVTCDQQLKELMANRVLREKYAGIVCAKDPTFAGGAFRWSPDWVTRVLACYLAEQASDFTLAFYQLARKKHYDFVPAEQTLRAEEAELIRQDLGRGLTHMIQEEVARNAKVLQDLKDGNRSSVLLQEELWALERAVSEGDATPEQRTRRELLHVWHRFREHFWDMTTDDISYAQEHMTAFYKLQWLNSDKRKQDCRWQDMVKLRREPLPEQAEMSFGQLQNTDAAARTLGFSGVLDYTTQVSAETVARKAKQVRTFCEQAARLENRRVQSTSKKPCSAALASFRRELRVLGHRLTAKRQRVAHAEQKQARARFYRIEPEEQLAALMPFANFSTTNVAAADLGATPEQVPRPKRPPEESGVTGQSRGAKRHKMKENKDLE